MRRVLSTLLLAALCAAEEPLGEEECRAFARAFEAEVAGGDLDAVLARIDWEELLDRVTKGTDPDEDFVKGFRHGLLRARKQPGQLVPAILEIVQRGGSLTLLRIHGKDGDRRALFRLLMPDDGGVNYHDLHLGRGRDGRLRVVDIYVALSAEDISATMRRLFLPLAADASKGFLAKLLGSESELVKSWPRVQACIAHVRAGRAAEGMRVYRSLPASVQREKFLLILRLQAAQKLGLEEYEPALADLRRHHPGDPCADMLSIDLHLFRGEHDEALACVDRLDEAVQGDPYLFVLRANILTMKGDREAAGKAARRAVEMEPGLQPAYWSLVQISLDEKRFADTVTWLKRIEKAFDLEFGDLSEIEGYEEFVKSPEYRAWREEER